MMANGTGLNDILKRLKELDKKKVRVGIFRDKNAKRRSKGNIVDTETPLAYVAAIHEFGTARTPQRAFMRGTIENHKQDISNSKARYIKEVLNNNMTLDEAFERIGNEVKAYMQEEIDKGDFAPLASSTIARKGSSQPLVDTGTLRNSIEYKVVDKGEE